MEWVIGIIIFLAVINTIFKPRRCGVCGQGFKKKYHTWTIEGKKEHLCPHCNSRMTRRVSYKRFNDRFGK
ncbi:hypothetical protein PQM29_002667 [Morganella morganii]|uniref:Uncharacterized protein n=1 Tax=Morganella morganii TaxID=582 RepID=A0AAU8ZK16_MORMO|nr:hypothetical protein AM380_08010 [Morganella morganii]EKW8486817.1 hypothetical protein [Morganella morganii]